MMKTAVCVLLWAALVAGQDPEDDVCPSEGKEGLDLSKLGGKAWHAAYLFPRSPGVSFFQTETCLQVYINYYPDKNQLGLKLQGLDPGDGEKEFDETYLDVDGAAGVGMIDGLVTKIAYLDSDYDNWTFGKSCFSRNNTVIEEEWWVITTAADGSLGPPEAEAAFRQSVEEKGFTHFFTEQHSRGLDKC